MKDCSVVTATYQIKEGVYGKIGIVGPKRMDYEKVVGTLENTDRIMRDTFWVRVYPGMTDEMIEYMAKTIAEAVYA